LILLATKPNRFFGKICLGF